MVTDVLRREKDAKSQAVQKVSRRQQASDGTHSKVSTLHEKFTNVLLLWYVITAVSTVLFH